MDVILKARVVGRHGLSNRTTLDKSVSLPVSLVALDCVQPAFGKDLFTSKNASLHLRL